MERPQSLGLKYYPFDVDLYDDPKILFIEEEQGIIGIYAYTRLLAVIYKNGYFLEWNDKMSVVISKKFDDSINSKKLYEIVSCCLENQLFNQEMFDKYGILSSRGIQKRWYIVNKRLRRSTDIVREFNLLDAKTISLITKTPNEFTETISETEETNSNLHLSTQKKVKESKVNEIKEKERKKNGKENKVKEISFFPPDLQAITNFLISFYEIEEEEALFIGKKYFSNRKSQNWITKAGKTINLESVEDDKKTFYK